MTQVLEQVQEVKFAMTVPVLTAAALVEMVASVVTVVSLPAVVVCGTIRSVATNSAVAVTVNTAGAVGGAELAVTPADKSTQRW